MKNTQHMVAVSADTLERLVERVNSISNIARFHHPILADGVDNECGEIDNIPYRKWTADGVTRFDTVVEVQP